MYFNRDDLYTLFFVAIRNYMIVQLGLEFRHSLNHHFRDRGLVVLEALDYLNHHLHNLKINETASSPSYFYGWL